MTEFDFETPSRQSAKGIIVIFGVSAFKVIRGTIIIIAAVLLKYLSSDNTSDLSQPKFVLPVIGLLLFLLVLAILRYLNFKFHLKDGYFFLKKGVLNKEEISISVSKIQNVYIKQNLLQQIIDVVSLSIETAGDDKTEIQITALPKSKAAALKIELLSSTSYEQKDIGNFIEDKVYFKASIKKLILEGVSENHLKSFVLIFAFLVSIYNDLQEFVNRFEFTNKFSEWFRLDSQSFMTLLLFNLTIIGLLLVVAFFFSLVRMFIQNYNLTVTQKSEGLEISKGLLNKINLALTSSRIQTATVSTNRLKRALGLYKLSFTQAMTNKKQLSNFNIVGLNKNQIQELISQFYPDLETRVKKFKPHIYLVYRMIWINILILLIANTGIYFLPLEFLYLNIPLVLYIGSNIFFMYQKAYYFLDKEYIIVGGGNLIDTYTSYLETHKTQSIKIKQTIFQKRRKLASVIIYSASKSLTIPHVDIERANQITNYLLYLVESQNKDWM